MKMFYITSTITVSFSAHFLQCYDEVDILFIDQNLLLVFILVFQRFGKVMVRISLIRFPALILSHKMFVSNFENGCLS